MQTVIAMWDKLNTVIKFIEKWVLIVLFVSMLLCGVLQIVARFVLHTPIAWSEEMLTYSFVWSSFWAPALAVDQLAHFNVDIFILQFSPQTGPRGSLPGLGNHALFDAFLVYKGTILAQLNIVQMMDVLPISMMWAYASLPVSAAFMFVHTAEKLLTGTFNPAIID